MVETITRRRAICIMAAAAGLPLMPFASGAEAAIEPVVWQGQALGAPATLILNIDDKVLAARLINRVMAEVARLESIFSLYKDGSALRELNRVGALVAPPSEMIALLEACRSAWDASGGAFDPTVQPLWMLYARHFSTPDADLAGPDRQALDAVLSCVGFDGVRFNRDRIAFARPEMGLSFNGIAQGYVTDRIVDLLREAGMTSSLVNMGESRAIGAQADGHPWRIGLAETEAGLAPDKILQIVNSAVSTSSPAGFHFDPSARFGHILDPRRGSVPPLYRRMTVIAPDATTADALSTAFSLMKPDAIQAFLQRHPEIAADMVAVPDW